MQITREEWLREKKQAAVVRYDTMFAPGYDDKWGKIDPTHARFVGELLRLAGRDRGCRTPSVLDAACGTGKYWPMLLQSGASVVGVDQSSEMLANLIAKFEDAQVYLQSLQELEVYPGEIRVFDAVMCVDAMENVPPEDWPMVLRRLRAQIGPGGYLYITVEEADEDILDESYAQAKDRNLPVVYGEVALDGYHYYPTRQSVLDWLNDAGFRVLKSESGDGYWHLIATAA